MSNIFLSEKEQSLNKENLYKAESKCRESRNLVKQACELQDPLLMYKAIESYTEAISIYPRLLEPYISIAYISLQYNQKNNAIMILNKALELDPNNKKAKNLLEKANSLELVSIYFPTKERIQKVQRLEDFKDINEPKEAKLVELKVKIKDDTFNILTELFMDKNELEHKHESILERRFDSREWTKETKENFAKLNESSNRAVRATIATNSPFSKLLKK